MVLTVQIAIFISGYVIWNIDNITCSWLTEAKRKIGMPLSFLLELHGWWHIFTGIGAYICMFLIPCHAPISLLEVGLTYLVIALVEYLTSEEAGEPLAGRFAWPVDMFLRKRLRSTPNIVRAGYGTLSKSNRKRDTQKTEAYMTEQAQPLRTWTNEAYESIVRRLNTGRMEWELYRRSKIMKW